MEKQSFVRLEKETAVKNFRYNRFLLLRYLLAGFFFMNLYWGLSLALSQSWVALLPFGLMVLNLPAIAEHLRFYGYPSKEIKGQLDQHRRYQWVQLGTNLVLVVMCWAGSGLQMVFPFLNADPSSRGFVSCILLSGILLSLLSLRKIAKIYANLDRHARYIDEFEQKNKE